MSEERPGYDAGGTIEIEVPVLLDLLLRVDATPGIFPVIAYRALDLRRRIMAGQVYVGVCDWPVEEVNGG